LSKTIWFGESDKGEWVVRMHEFSQWKRKAKRGAKLEQIWFTMMEKASDLEVHIFRLTTLEYPWDKYRIIIEF